MPGAATPQRFDSPALPEPSPLCDHEINARSALMLSMGRWGRPASRYETKLWGIPEIEPFSGKALCPLRRAGLPKIEAKFQKNKKSPLGKKF